MKQGTFTEKEYTAILNGAAAGDHSAIYQLALLHRDRKFSIALLNEIRDDDNATSWAKATLASLRLLGADGVTMDIKDAIETLSDHESTPFFAGLCVAIAYCYIMGEYVDENPNVGFAFLHKAVQGLENGDSAESLLLMAKEIKMDFCGLLARLEAEADDVLKYNSQPLEDFLYVVDHVIAPQIEKLTDENERRDN